MSSRIKSGVTSAAVELKADTPPPLALKRFRVGYWMEEGYSVVVEAASEDEALSMVEDHLIDEGEALENSERVHFDTGVCDAEEVCS